MAEATIVNNEFKCGYPKMNYRVHKNEKSKEWVVLVHGIGGSQAIFFKQFRFLRNHYNVVMMDLYGHGKTESSLGDLDEVAMKYVSKGIIKILDELKIIKAHFVGISLGSTVINVINNYYPERVKSMLLGGAVVSYNKAHRGAIHAVYAIKKILPPHTTYNIAAWLIMPLRNHKESRQAFIKSAYKVKREELFKWLKIIRDIGVSEDTKIQRKGSKKLYVMGSQDYVLIKKVEEESKSDPNADIVIIDGAGHVCNIDDPDSFNKIMKDFIDLNHEDTA